MCPSPGEPERISPQIEHRLFFQITPNWRGRPLTSHQVIVDLIANTKTATGLSVRAVLETGQYPTGISYSDKDIAALPPVRHDFYGDWNYTCDMRSHTASELEAGRVD